MMFQLVLAYLFAVSTGVTLVCLARKNRKQGWQRPPQKWFGIALETREPATVAVSGTSLGSEELTPQLLRLNRELAAYGAPIRPEVEALETPELVSVSKSQDVSTRRV